MSWPLPRQLVDVVCRTLVGLAFPFEKVVGDFEILVSRFLALEHYLLYCLVSKKHYSKPAAILVCDKEA